MSSLFHLDRRAILTRLAALSAFTVSASSTRANELPECQVQTFSSGKWSVWGDLRTINDAIEYAVFVHPETINLTFRTHEPQRIMLSSSQLIHLNVSQLTSPSIFVDWNQVRELRNMGLVHDELDIASYVWWLNGREVKGLRTDAYLDGSLLGANKDGQFFSLKANDLPNATRLTLNLIDSNGVLPGSTKSAKVASLELELEGIGRAASDGRKREAALRAKFDEEGCQTTGGGGCILTTICCESVGLADDCFELRTLRAFRDDYLSKTAEGRNAIERYYDLCPRLLENFQLPEKELRFRQMYWSHIIPCVVAIRCGLREMAFRRYRSMIFGLIADARSRSRRKTC